MLGNWVTVHDLRRLRDILARGEWRRVLLQAGRDSRERTRAAWEHTKGPPVHAWEIPALRRRWNRLVSGAEEVDHVEHTRKRYLPGRGELTAFSPCCGGGGNELRWAATGAFRLIDACDLSAPRIAAAREAAEKAGLSAITRFSQSDWRQSAAAAPYDVVIAEGALHHLYPMRPALERIRRLLKPGGLLIVNDFVGPSRFQWTAGQLRAANAFLAQIPAEYRRRWSDRRVKKAIDAPGRLRMWLADPSEAAESSRILPLLGEMFHALELREKGGAVACLVFDGIAQAYIRPDETAAAILSRCFAAEDRLMRDGEIASDYVFGVFRNPGS